MMKCLKKLWVVITVVLLFASCTPSKGQADTGRFASYDSLKTYMTTQQQQFQKQYKAADATKKETILKAARDTVFTYIVNDYFGFWYGTPWDFNGTTHTPRKGKIACGYFVTTVLEDAGFKIPRTKWAMMASEPVIKLLSKNIKHIINKPAAEVEEYIKKSGTGLYIVGLDNHVGFIYNNGTIIRFVHSNYYLASQGVMAQEIDSHNPLKDSKYRVIGKILDDTMMQNWIQGKKIE